MLGKFAPLLGVALLFVPVIGQWAALNMWNAAMYGFMAGGVASGSLKGALVGALSGAAFQQIGASFDAKSGFWEAGGVGHVGAHATTGGISSVLQGGKFGHGFVSAGFTKAININNLVGTQQGGLWDQVRISAAAVVGGTISKITGGKFANGAITAGFAQAFNGNKQAAADDYKKKIQARVSVSTTTDGESHVYRIKGLICNQSEAGCNGTLADRVFDSVNRNDVPFTSNDLGNGTSNLLGFNPVTHTEYPDMRMSVNTTMEGHTFHPGDVVHSVYFDEGNLYYEVIGTGGVHPNLNNAVGVYLFKPGVESAVYNFQSNSIWRKAHGF
ncbi:MAG: DUF637 domain-containing protein [Gammaproteobacteria bacterium]|nr:DUF637 domain-containing protein [Gammaproteobacteria bacterium]